MFDLVFHLQNHGKVDIKVFHYWEFIIIVRGGVGGFNKLLHGAAAAN